MNNVETGFSLAAGSVVRIPDYNYVITSIRSPFWTQ